MARMPLGPGPGAYALPPTVGYERHDNRKQRMPQYSFGARTAMFGPDGGPGPGAYQVDKLTRNGTNGAPIISMAPMTKIIDKRVGPGPGAHDNHIKPIFKGTNAPIYSMAARNDYNFKKIGPGPSAYKVEVRPIRPAAPAYSMGLKGINLKKLDSPGPAAYSAVDVNIKLHRQPKYSMRPMCNLRQENVGPGPCYYDLTYYRPGRSGREYSFGIRHSPYAPPMIVRCDNM